MAGVHKDGTASFEELTYAEQAKSINAVIIDLEKSIIANIRRAESEGKENPLPKRIQNLKDMISRLESM